MSLKQKIDRILRDYRFEDIDNQLARLMEQANINTFNSYSLSGEVDDTNADLTVGLLTMHPSTAIAYNGKIKVSGRIAFWTGDTQNIKLKVYQTGMPSIFGAIQIAKDVGSVTYFSGEIDISEFVDDSDDYEFTVEKLDGTNFAAKISLAVSYHTRFGG